MKVSEYIDELIQNYDIHYGYITKEYHNAKLRLRILTGGWSENEKIHKSMDKRFVNKYLCFLHSGGEYEYRIPMKDLKIDIAEI